MITPSLLPDPRLLPFVATRRRELSVFGAPVEAVLVPDRKARQGIAEPLRPPFARPRAADIVAAEAFWRDDGLALTPNRFPFAHQQRILWPTEPDREPDAAMWAAICAWVDASAGTAMVNTIGAAASIARAHAHLTPESLPFLSTIGVDPGPLDLVELPAEVELVVARLPFHLLGIRGGSATARGLTITRLAEARLTPSWNVVVQTGTAWLYPRRVEIPAPHFPSALGAAELWGRWCYVAEEPFAAVSGQALERALIEAGLEY
ncbi:MAG: hypothetical protein KDC98_23295 [Planctomycetes bacterium]|nr:hypothetical protein [Planctomycetota bacterium]